MAEFFTDRALRTADSLQIGLNIGPKALHPPGRMAVAQASARHLYWRMGNKVKSNPQGARRNFFEFRSKLFTALDKICP